LGYEVTTLHSDTKQTQTKNGKRKRSSNGRVGLRIPHTVVREKCNRYQKGGKAVHRAELLNESDSTISSTYQLESRGIVEYSRLAYNFHTLQLLKWIMETSLTTTLASQHKLSVKKIYKKYQTELEVEGKKYKVLQVTVQREGKNPLVATWGGIPLTWDIKAPIQDRPGPQWNRRSERERRLLAQTCEICEATRMTTLIEVHHIRALKDLQKYDGREKPLWVKVMAARRRKTLVLCHTCHDDLHAGRPLRQQGSRSRTGST